MKRALRLARAWPVAAVLAVGSSSAQMAETCARRVLSQAAPSRPAPAAAAMLLQRRDIRAQAMADYLLAASGAADGATARIRLQDRARSTADPMVTVLALHMPCSGAGCRNVEASQWSRLEPANLLAWLALPARAAADGRYLLDEIATQVRYSRNYLQEAAALLADLPPSSLSLRQPWGLLNFRALAGSCRGAGDLLTAERCEKVAGLLWADGGATEQIVALLLVQRPMELLPQHRPAWEPRLRAMDAVMSAAGPVGVRRDRVCEALVQTRDGERAAMSDRERAVLALQLTGLSHAELRPRPRNTAAEPRVPR